MYKVDSKKVEEYLREKWGPLRACPMCEEKRWFVPDSTFQLLELDQGGIVLGGSAIPVLPVICSKCGNTVLINAILAGFVTQQPTPPERKEAAR